MKPSEIFEILNLTKRARELDEIFNPLLIGPPGLGKSHIVQQWAKANGYKFLDLRSAYLEAPDVRGFPFVTVVDGRQRMTTAVPEMWPATGKVVIMLEEVNRGPTSVMNAWMQLLTDRKIDDFEISKEALIVGAINEGPEYDVNPIDPALRNRFVTFNVNYDKQTFLDYMNAQKFHKDIINFIESNTWTYKEPEEAGNIPGGKYISPRTYSQLNAVLKAELSRDMEQMVYAGILGDLISKDFYRFRHEETPVMMADLEKNLKAALKKLKTYSDPNNYKAGLVSLTSKDVLEVNTISDEMLIELCDALPIEQGSILIRELQLKRNDKTMIDRLTKQSPKLLAAIKSMIKYNT